MSFNFSTPGGCTGAGLSFATPALTTTPVKPGPSLQGGGAPKLVRFDTPVTSTTAAPFSGFGAAPASSAPAAAGNTLAGLLAAPQNPAPTFGGGLLGQLGASSGATAGTTGLSGLAPASGVTRIGFSGFGTAATTTASTATSLFGGFSASSQVGLIGTTTTAQGLGGGLGGTLGGGLGGGLGVGLGSALGGGLGGGLCPPGQGLGGVGLSSTVCGVGVASSGGGASSKTCDVKALKEQELPAELRATVEELTKHVRAQKQVREEIARMSARGLHRVDEDVRTLHEQLIVVSTTLQKYTSSIERLKRESTRDLRSAEVAQHTKDTPPGLQFENVAPDDYFDRLIDDFHSQMATYRTQIAATESHFSSASAIAAGPLSPQDLSALFVRLNEGFLAVAARLHSVHEAVRAQRDAYVKHRKAFHADFSAADEFERGRKCRDAAVATRSGRFPATTVGLSPFAATSNAAGAAMASAMGRGTGTMPGGTACAGSSAATPSTGLGAGRLSAGGLGAGMTGANQKMGFGLARPLG